MAPEIEGFTIEAEVGRGGFGVVYRARQLAFNRPVAIKVLHSSSPSEALQRQFAKECRAVGALRSHAHILRVYSTGTTSAGTPYLAMELLGGGTLSQRIPLSVDETRVLGVKLATALQIAHDGGVVHRDVKPGNVLYNDDDEPVLVDFGISSIAGEASTTDKAVALSLGYSPPEVLDGARAATSADVYSLGATLFAALTGHAPFVPTDGVSSIAVLAARIANAPLEDLRPMGVPDSLCAVIERAMAKDPVARFPSMAAMRQALEASDVDLDSTVRATDSRWAGEPAGESADGSTGGSVGRASGRAPDGTPTAPRNTTIPEPRRPQLGTRRPRRRRRTAAVAAAIGVLVIGGGTALALHELGGSSTKGHGGTPAATKARASTDLDCNGYDDLLAVGGTGVIKNALLLYPRAPRLLNGLRTDWEIPDTGEKTVDPGFGITSFISLITPGDITGDGDPDLIGEDKHGNLWRMDGNCTGVFTAASAQQIVAGNDAGDEIIGPGDLNGDGVPDLLLVSTEGDLYLYPGTKSGTFRDAVYIASGWTSAIAAGDVNGDGVPDVINRTSDGTLDLYYGTGHGTLSAHAIRLHLRLPPSEFPFVIGGVSTTLGKYPDLLAIDNTSRLVTFAATTGGQYATTCHYTGSGWSPTSFPRVADASRMLNVPLPHMTVVRGNNPPAECETKAF